MNNLTFSKKKENAKENKILKITNNIMQLEIKNPLLLILDEAITLCLSIILKWNKIYTSSNTTILYIIN
jgi:hypothetical protein